MQDYVVQSGVTSTGLSLSDNKEMIVYSGGVAIQTTVNVDGRLDVYSGGVASNTTVNNVGSMGMNVYGVAIETTVNVGRMQVFSGGVASNTTVNNGGSMYINSGSVASNTTVNNGGSMTVSSGVAIETTINDNGRLDVRGGVASNTTVNNDGFLKVSKGCMVKDITVSSGGRLNIDRSTITGKMTFADGAIVNVAGIIVIDFDISGLAPANAELVNNFLFFYREDVTYTLTVGGTQTAGTYRLAEGAAGFDSTITVMNTVGTELCTLTVDGGTVEIGDTKYTLALNGSSLAVTIVTPNGPEEPLNNYLYDATKAKEDPPEPVLNTNVTDENGNYLRTTHDEICLDKIGTVDSAGYHNHVGADDVTDFAKLTLEHGARVSFDLSATDATKFSVWSLTSGTDKKGNTTYKQKSKQATTLKKPKGATTYSAQTKNLFLEAGVYYVSMQSTNAKKGGDALYNVTVNGDTSAKNYTIIYDDGDDGWNNYLYDKKQDEPLNPNRNSFITTDIYANASEVVLDSGVLHADETGTWKNFAGFCDDTDFGRVYLYDDSRVSFTVNATDAAKFTIWKLVEGTDKKGNTTYTQKNLQTTTLKKNRETGLYTAETKPLLLEYGYYFISMQSTNAKKGGATYYNVEVNQADCEYFAASDNGWNNYLYDKKNKDNPLNFNVYEGSARTIDSETVSVWLDERSYEDESGTTWDNFVGFGDAADFQKICLNSNAKLSFALAATDATKFTIWRLDEKEDKKGNIVYTQKSLQATTLKKDKETGLYSADTKLLSLDAGVYYVSMESTNASKGGRAYYNVEVDSFIAEDAVASALAMPESEPALGFAETCAGSATGLLASL